MSFSVGDRVAYKNNTSITGVVYENEFYGFVDMTDKVYVKWDIPQGSNRITGQTIQTWKLLKLSEITKIDFEYDDGGRADAGFKGTTGDCGVRAIAIAAKLPYKEVYEDINRKGKNERLGKRQKSKSSARNGISTKFMRKYMKDLGWKWTATMKVGSGCKVHLNKDELPSGRIIVRVSKHFTTMIDGVLHDTYNCARGGTRCVYGYWSK